MLSCKLHLVSFLKDILIGLNVSIQVVIMVKVKARSNILRNNTQIEKVTEPSQRP